MSTPKEVQEAVQRACEIVGSQAEMARRLGIEAGNVWQWANGVRAVPPRFCARIEQLTDGAVTRRDLRPNDWAMYWPELEAAA